MSETTMLGFCKSETVVLATFQNAFGSAFRVWDALSQKYCGGKSVIMMSEPESKAFWRLATDNRLSRCEQLVLAWTFDGAMVEASRMSELAELMQEFDAMLPAPSGRINHLPAINSALLDYAGHGVGVGFIQTSVNADAWHVPCICEHSFHATRNDDDVCPQCANTWDERHYWALFDFDRDKNKQRHFMLFANYDV